jgi:hypothetical protein
MQPPRPLSAVIDNQSAVHQSPTNERVSLGPSRALSGCEHDVSGTPKSVAGCSWHASIHDVVQPIIFRTSYCSLQEDTLAHTINDDLEVLSKELHASVAPTEAIIFYYGWHSDAALVDVAIPAADALDRPRTNDVQASIMPHQKRSLVPTGGIVGLRSARRQLRLEAGAIISDQLFRIWQRVPLRNGVLADDWLSATAYCSI